MSSKFNESAYKYLAKLIYSGGKKRNREETPNLRERLALSAYKFLPFKSQLAINRELGPWESYAKTSNVSFVIPVIDDKVHVVRRGTEPFRGFYGAAGGKVERLGKYEPGFGTPTMILKQGDHPVESIADLIAREEGNEFPMETALREFSEELFTHLKYPYDFSKSDNSDVVRVGFVDDTLPDKPGLSVHIQFYLVRVNRKDFKPSEREVMNDEMVPLVDLPKDAKIFPLTKFAFAEIKYWLTELADTKKYSAYKGLEAQIPDYDLEGYKFTCMPGAAMKLGEQGYLR